MSTKTDLFETWVKWTGDPVPEARARIRALYEANLLPGRSASLTHGDIARTLLGFLVSETHKEAADAVIRFSEFGCISNEGAHHGELTSLSLLRVIIAALHEPLLIVEMEVSLTHSEVSVTIADQNIALETDSANAPSYTGKYTFGKQPGRILRPAPLPIEIIRKVGFPLIRILTALVKEPSARYLRQSETTMAAEAPPSNSHRAKSKQAIEQPASASTEQSNDTPMPEQRPGHGGLSSPRHLEGHSPDVSKPRIDRPRST